MIKHKIKIISTAGKVLGMALLTFAFSFCDGGDQGEPAVPPTCEEISGQVYNAGANRCECPGEQFLNSDSTACVDSCPDDEVKPNNSEKCEPATVCTGKEVLNPETNLCMPLNCEDGQIPDTTVDPPVCISLANCRSGTGKFVNVARDTCITKSACTITVGQVAKTGGDCEVCGNTTPIRDKDKTSCIDATTCTATSGQVANDNGDCEVCSGDTPLTNIDKNSCIDQFNCLDEGDGDGNYIVSSDEIACISQSECSGAGTSGFVVDVNLESCTSEMACKDLMGHAVVGDPKLCLACTSLDKISSVDQNSCIDAADCTKTLGQVNNNGACLACPDSNSLSHPDQDRCISRANCLSENNVVLDNKGCITKTACSTMTDFAVGVNGRRCIMETDCEELPGHVVTGTPKTCTDCTTMSGQIANVDRDTCIPDTTCMNTDGLANVSGTCTACSGGRPRTNSTKTMCVADDCGPTEIKLGANACIRSSACRAVAGRAVENDTCATCSGGRPRTNSTKTMCVADDCGATEVKLETNACTTELACRAVAGRAIVSDTCVTCSGGMPRSSVDRTMCVANCAMDETPLDNNGCLTSDVICTTRDDRYLSGGMCITCPEGQIRNEAGTGCEKEIKIVLFLTLSSTNGDFADNNNGGMDAFCRSNLPQALQNAGYQTSKTFFYSPTNTRTLTQLFRGNATQGLNLSEPEERRAKIQLLTVRNNLIEPSTALTVPNLYSLNSDLEMHSAVAAAIHQLGHFPEGSSIINVVIWFLSDNAAGSYDFYGSCNNGTDATGDEVGGTTRYQSGSNPPVYAYGIFDKCWGGHRQICVVGN